MYMHKQDAPLTSHTPSGLGNYPAGRKRGLGFSGRVRGFAPLAAIALQAEVLQQAVSNTQRRAGMEFIEHTARRINTMFEAFCDVADGELSHRLRCGKTDIRHLLQDCVAPHRDAWEEGRIELLVADQVDTAVLDGSRIARALTFVLDNALRASKPEKVTVTASSVGSTDVCFNVTDLGPGIAEKDQSLIFKPFWPRSSHGDGGLGLGLYVAELTANAHGGTLVVRSRLGVGSTFTLTVPRHGPGRLPWLEAS